MFSSRRCTALDPEGRPQQEMLTFAAEDLARVWRQFRRPNRIVGMAGETVNGINSKEIRAA